MDRIKKIWTTLCLTLVNLVIWAPSAFAQVGAADNDFSMKKYIALAAGLGLALAAGLGATGQGKAAAAAMEGIARNPSAGGRLFTTLILSLALIESLGIYSLVISIMLIGKL